MSSAQVVAPDKVPFVDLVAQYESIKGEIDAAISGVLRRADFVLGEDVELFETEFAAYCGAAQAVAVDSGTSALELALRAFHIGEGDEVITVANTFIATASAISFTGARPVLVDCDPRTYTIDVAQVESAITPRTRAIIPVHLYGQAADMDPIVAIAGRYGLVVIEDACQAHGARYKGRRVGALGDAAAFSFYPAKNLGGCGDGGILTMNDAQTADRVRRLRNYGQTVKYHHVEMGYNHRLDTIQAAVLRVKLPYLDRWNAQRRDHAARYDQLFAGSSVVVPAVANYAEPVYHLYVIQTPVDRDGLRQSLQEQGIGTGIHYPIPIHLQESYCDLDYPRGQFPVTERLADRGVSLPMFAELNPAAIERVSQVVQAFVQQAMS